MGIHHYPHVLSYTYTNGNPHTHGSPGDSWSLYSIISNSDSYAILSVTTQWIFTCHYRILPFSFTCVAPIFWAKWPHYVVIVIAEMYIGFSNCLLNYYRQWSKYLWVQTLQKQEFGLTTFVNVWVHAFQPMVDITNIRCKLYAETF